MKKLIALITALTMAATAVAAPPKKDDKSKAKEADKKKEVPAMMWDVVIEGATSETAEQEVKAMLADVKGLKVESIAKKDANIEAVVSSAQRLSRSDITKAIKDNKALKVKDFKSKKPAKEGDKKEEPKKEEPKKTEPAKKPEAKPAATKPEAKPEAPKTEAPKTEAPKTEAPKADAPPAAPGAAPQPVK